MKNLLFICLTILISNTTISVAQNFEWAKRIGNSQNEVENVSCIDLFGNVYLAGSFKGTVDFDPGASTFNLSSNSNSFDIFITKLDPLGNFLWAKSLGGSAGESIKYITCDSTGNVFVSGVFQGTLNLNTDSGGSQIVSTPFPSDYDYFILKLNSLGQFDFGFAIGHPGINTAPIIKIDNNQNLVMGGFLPGAADLDPSSNTFNLWGNYGTSFIAKYTNSGSFIWAKNFGTAPIPYPYGSSFKDFFIDESNNIHITGEYTNSADLNPDTSIVLNQTVSGNSDIYLLKLDENGIFQNVKTLGGNANTYISGNELKEGVKFFETDNNSNFYIGGYFIGDVNFDLGGNNVTLNASQGGQFVAKYDSAYNLLWVKQFAIELTNKNGLAIDLHENLYLTGKFEGTADFNPGTGVNTLTSASPRVFILKLDSMGNFVWVNKLDYADNSFAINVDNLGNITNSGTFGGGLGDFDPSASNYNLQSAGANDYYILKWSEDSCSNIAIVFDSLTNVSCLNDGYISSHVVNGFPPYQYFYNNSSVSDSTFISTQSGIFNLNTQDSYGCQTSTSFLMGGPSTNQGFDLGVNLVFPSFQSGFQSLMQIDAFNEGCISTNGQIKLVLDTALGFVSSTPLHDTINGDTLIWNFTPIDYQSPHIIIPISVSVSPFALINNPINIYLSISPINVDAFPNNNIRNYDALSVGAFDPNDKSVYPKGSCNAGYVLPQSMLTYTIRFQNTGNATAHNVVILDSLFSDFNLNTLRIVGQSHNVITEILPNKILKFNFNNIMLPDSNINAPASHGYIIFEVKPDAVSNGTVIKNKSYIYFDFNEPIITNTVQNKVVNSIPIFTPSVISTVNQIYVTYGFAPFNWVNCKDISTNIGIYTNFFNMPPDGVYAVYASSNEGCIGISNCINYALGVSDIVDEMRISVSPNPAFELLNIDTPNKMQIKIVDVFGKILSQHLIKNKLSIDISSFSNGLYFIIDENGNVTKFVKL